MGTTSLFETLPLGALLPLVMLAIAAVDAVLGARAEYLNATAIAEGWWRLVTTGAARSSHAMFFGADALAPLPRLFVGTALWTLEAAVVAAVLVLAVRVAS
ncbi:MAG: hypothetical protein KC619_30495 [Myxococcales bacterium]|nr:hypothetical protein [Myxococcales bacterium]